MKAVKWEIPFESTQDKIKYKICIYEEDYEGTPIVLIGGSSPIVTSEDNGEDPFNPLRPWNGTIEICNEKPDGSLLEIEEMIPNSNTSRPVVLRKLDDNENWIDVWNGFISADTFEQPYNDSTRNIQLNVISPLEAMDSVELDNTQVYGVKEIREIIYDCLTSINNHSGVTCYDAVFISKAARSVFDKYIDTTIFFDTKEQMNGSIEKSIVVSKSCKEILSMIATSFGMVVRENNTEIYFCRSGEELGFVRYNTLSDFIRNRADFQNIEIHDVDMKEGDMEWMGEDHQISIAQGAKSVEVVANVGGDSFELGMPKTPSGDFELKETTTHNEYGNITGHIDSYALKSNDAYSNLEFRYFKGHYHNRQTPTNIVESNILAMINGLFTGELWWDERDTEFDHVAGVLFTKTEYYEDPRSDHKQNKYSDRLLVSYLYGDMNPMSDIFRIKSGLRHTLLHNGYINLNITAKHIFDFPVFPEGEEQYTYGFFGYAENVPNGDFRTEMMLRVGGYYWNGSAWQTTECTFQVNYAGGCLENTWNLNMGVEKADGLFIPVTDMLSGEVELRLYPRSFNSNGGNNKYFYSFIESINIRFCYPINLTLNDRSENHYYELINANFKDEIRVNVDLSSNLNNNPSPFILQNDDTGESPVDTILYYGKTPYGVSSSEERKPEIDLLKRLRYYYIKSRSKLTLISKHVSVDSAPLLRMLGYETPEKKYTPIAEERNWQEDISTYTCVEEVEGVPII